MAKAVTCTWAYFIRLTICNKVKTTSKNVKKAPENEITRVFFIQNSSPIFWGLSMTQPILACCCFMHFSLAFTDDYLQILQLQRQWLCLLHLLNSSSCLWHPQAVSNHKEMKYFKLTYHTMTWISLQAVCSHQRHTPPSFWAIIQGSTHKFNFTLSYTSICHHNWGYSSKYNEGWTGSLAHPHKIHTQLTHTLILIWNLGGCR